MNLKTVTVADLKPHPDNPNTHPPKQIDELAKSLTKFTQIKNVVIWNDRIIAGHGVIEAAKKAGILTLEAQDISHWPEERATEFMLADIRLPDMGFFDEAAMVEALRHIDEPLDIPGFDEEFLKGLDGWEVEGPKEEGPIEPGAAEKAQEVWGVKEGDVWQLGRHKIACIDSLDGEAVKGLIGGDEVGMVWADPPYGINIVDLHGHIGGENLAELGNYTQVVGDNTTETAIKAFALAAKYGGIQIWWGANYYADMLPLSSSWIVWDKENGENNFADCELAWTNHTGAVRIFRHMWQGMLKASEHGQRRIHPTQKPAALFEWAANKYFKEGGIVFDPFLGSGISVIGAENIGDSTSVIGCELSPEYIAAILQRFLDHTNITPELTK